MIPWFDASHLRIAGHDLPTQGPLAVAGIAVGQITFGRWLQRHLGLTPLQTDLFGFAAVAAEKNGAVITAYPEVFGVKVGNALHV